MNRKTVKDFVAWARANKIKRPKTKEALGILFAQFIAQAQMRQQEAERPAWDEIPDDRDTHLTWDGVKTQIVDVLPQGTFKDDWQHLLEQRAEAAVGPNGEHLDDFDREFQLQEKNLEAIKQAAPYVGINPASAVNQVLGGQLAVTPGDPPREIARWTGENPETTNVTITIGQATVAASSRQSAFHQPIQARPFAVVQWGTRGIPVVAEVDAFLGTQFTIGASFVSLQMAMEALSNPPAQTAVPATLTMTAMLSFRVVERNKPLTRTHYDDSFAVLKSSFKIPPFAIDYTFICDDPTTTAQFDVFDIGNNLICSAVAVSGDPAKAKTIPLPPDANTMNWQNVTGSPQAARIIFGLSL